MLRRAWPLALLALLCGCTDLLAPGQWGTPRYFAEIPGTTPLRLHPPRSDREGNVYVVHGDRERTENLIYVGHHDGGWSGGCSEHRGEFGVHGIVGSDADRAWLWSGDLLVEVSGTTGACDEILSHDPTTGTQLDFLAVVPWIVDTPSRTTLLALIQGPTDPHPFHVVVDLDNRDYFDLSGFEPEDAEDLRVLGTGADPDRDRGYIVVSYLAGAGRRTEALALDREGVLVGRIELDLPDDLAAYAILGFLQPNDAGLMAGLLEDGRLLVFNDNSGGPKNVDGLTPGGMLRHEGTLWVSGTDGGDPVVARLGDGGDLGGAERFDTARTADGGLGGNLEVMDERSDPSRFRSWDDARSAMSTQSLISPYPLDVYTTASTGWLIAGPGYSTGIEGMTAVAYAPVGLAVP